MFGGKLFQSFRANTAKASRQSGDSGQRIVLDSEHSCSKSKRQDGAWPYEDLKKNSGIFVLYCISIL